MSQFSPKDITVAIDSIAVHQTDRATPILDEVAIVKKMATMQRLGLMQRIGICHEGTGYRLVWGAHRLEAAKRLGWSEIDARLVSHDRLDREEFELTENLARSSLSPLDHAAHVTRYYEVLAQRAGVETGPNFRAVGAAARWNKDRSAKEAGDANVKITVAYGITEEIAARADVSKSSIEKSLRLYRLFERDEAMALRTTAFARNASQLLRLAALDPKQRTKMIDAIVKHGAKSWNDALTISGGAKAKASETPEAEKRVARMRLWWRTLEPKRRAELLDLLVLDAADPAIKARLPAGYAITVPTKKGGVDA